MFYKRFKKQCLYILIAVILFILIIHNANVAKKYEVTNAVDKIARDFVLSDLVETSADENTKEAVPSIRNKLNIYLGRNKNETLYKSTNLAYLKTWAGKKPIFIHPPEKDRMISARLRDFGTWEEDFLNQTGMFIRRHPDMTFVDLGCNIGVYTLFVATFGVRVVAVDPLEDNLDLLQMTSRTGGLENNVTLVLNAISDKYQTVTVATPRDNVGGAHIVDKLPSNGGTQTLVLRETILLDDLVPYIEDENVFIKMDIEGHEWNALHGGRQFFQSKNVRGILMEWVHHRHTDRGQYIIDFLLKEGLLPYTDVTMSTILDSESYYTWPENIFWIKR